jgi:hypothetical protein
MFSYKTTQLFYIPVIFYNIGFSMSPFFLFDFTVFPQFFFLILMIFIVLPPRMLAKLQSFPNKTEKNSLKMWSLRTSLMEVCIVELTKSKLRLIVPTSESRPGFRFVIFQEIDPLCRISRRGMTDSARGFSDLTSWTINLSSLRLS